MDICCKFLKGIQSENSILHDLLPQKTSNPYNVWKQKNFPLLQCRTNRYKTSFIPFWIFNFSETLVTYSRHCDTEWFLLMYTCIYVFTYCSNSITYWQIATKINRISSYLNQHFKLESRIGGRDSAFLNMV